MRGNFRKNEAKDSTNHRTVGSNGGLGEMERTTKIQKEIGNLRDSRLRDGTAMTTTPIAIGYPLGLVIDSGKLASHPRRESKMTCRSLAI